MLEPRRFLFAINDSGEFNSPLYIEDVPYGASEVNHAKLAKILKLLACKGGVAVFDGLIPIEFDRGAASVGVGPATKEEMQEVYETLGSIFIREALAEI